MVKSNLIILTEYGLSNDYLFLRYSFVIWLSFMYHVKDYEKTNNLDSYDHQTIIRISRK